MMRKHAWTHIMQTMSYYTTKPGMRHPITVSSSYTSSAHVYTAKMNTVLHRQQKTACHDLCNVSDVIYTIVHYIRGLAIGNSLLTIST